MAIARYMVAQLGARMHYAVPRILERAGALSGFVTDFYANRRLSAVGGLIPGILRGRFLRSAARRKGEGLPEEKIRQFRLFAVEFLLRRKLLRRQQDETELWLWAGKEFCRLVNLIDWKDCNRLYLFNSAGLEIMDKARSAGISCALEQTVAPRSIMDELIMGVARRYPDWGSRITHTKYHGDYIAREEKEWELADSIICGSEFVKRSIIAKGILARKCIVVPYGVELPESITKKEARTGPLRVLYVGAIGLRKGAPVALEATARLGSDCEFRMVGQLEVSRRVIWRYSKRAQIIGPVSRDKVDEQYRWADLLLLPSVCEGSATVTYEALVRGVPVICTLNTGSVIRDGIDGWIVDSLDAEGIYNRLKQLVEDRKTLLKMKEEAFEGRYRASIDSYADRLLSALGCAQCIPK